jgi:hypothetical protein
MRCEPYKCEYSFSRKPVRIGRRVEAFPTNGNSGEAGRTAAIIEKHGYFSNVIGKFQPGVLPPECGKRVLLQYGNGIHVCFS